MGKHTACVSAATPSGLPPSLQPSEILLTHASHYDLDSGCFHNPARHRLVSGLDFDQGTCRVSGSAFGQGTCRAQRWQLAVSFEEQEVAGGLTSDVDQSGV